MSCKGLGNTVNNNTDISYPLLFAKSLLNLVPKKLLFVIIYSQFLLGQAFQAWFTGSTGSGFLLRLQPMLHYGPFCFQSYPSGCGQDLVPASCWNEGLHSPLNSGWMHFWVWAAVRKREDRRECVSKMDIIVFCIT